MSEDQQESIEQKITRRMGEDRDSKSLAWKIKLALLWELIKETAKGWFGKQ